jgi:Escherichia/Staphylococcus phage prohead protease
MSDRLAEFERRAAPGRLSVDLADDRHIRGRPIVFNSLSKVMSHRDIGKFRERIRPEAVDRTLRSGGSIKALWNHNDDLVLGNTKSGTLGLKKASDGLDIDIDPPKWATPYLETIDRGDVDGMSFGFRVLDDDWEFRSADGIPIRDIIDMEFAEISIVAFQAYEGTSVNVAEVGLSKRSLESYADILSTHRRTAWRAQFQEIQRIVHG